jgi:hypothetical protein
MQEAAGALDKLYGMLQEADKLGLSRPARLRLIGIIGSFEDEELSRYRRTYETKTGDNSSAKEDERLVAPFRY